MLVDHGGVFESLDVFNVVLHESCDLEQFSCSLAVTGGDDGGVHLEESLLGEEFMGGECQCRPHACHAAHDVGAGPQVGNGPQGFGGDLALADRLLFV